MTSPIVFETLHAHEITPADAALIELVRSLGPLPNDCPWVLPSGKVITAAEMRRWIGVQS